MIWPMVIEMQSNQMEKIFPGIIKNTTKEINDVAQERINQIISQGGKEVETVLPKIIRGLLKTCIRHPLGCLGILANNN